MDGRDTMEPFRGLGEREHRDIYYTETLVTLRFTHTNIYYGLRVHWLLLVLTELKGRRRRCPAAPPWPRQTPLHYG